MYNLNERLGTNFVFKYKILLRYVLLNCITQLHSTALRIYVFFNVHVYREHFISDYTFCMNFANDFLMKFEILYTIAHCTFVHFLAEDIRRDFLRNGWG